MDKNQAMALVASGRLRESYEHIGDDGKEYSFDVTALREYVQKTQARRMEASIGDVLSYLLRSRQYDISRVMSLPRESYMNDPAIVVVLDEPDSPRLIVDGVHRIMRRWVEKLQTFEFYSVAEKDAPRPSAMYVNTEEIGLGWGKPLIRR